MGLFSNSPQRLAVRREQRAGDALALPVDEALPFLAEEGQAEFLALMDGLGVGDTD